MNIWKKFGVSAVFLSCLLLGFLASAVLPDRSFSQTENRYLQQKPAFSWEGLTDGSYGEAYEAYLGDQFPFRDRVVELKTAAERLLGREDINGVYFGKDGYLLEKFDRENVETELAEKNLKLLAAFLESESGRLGEDRVRALLVPSASWILREKLPFLAAPYDQGEITDRLVGLLGGSRLLTDGEAALRECRDEEIYYRTDHHWTVLGAYEGYRAWALSAGFVPWEREDFERETVSRDFYGTVQAKVNWKTEPDRMERWTPGRQISYQVFYDGSGEDRGSLYTESALETRDKYRFYLDGNHGLTEIRTEGASDGDGREAEAGRRLCVIKDSYANSFVPFAVNHYETAFVLDLRYFNGNLGEFLERNGITDILVLYRIPGFAAEESLWKLERAVSYEYGSEVAKEKDL